MERAVEADLKRQADRLVAEAPAAKAAAQDQAPAYHTWMAQVELLVAGLGERGNVFARLLADARDPKRYEKEILLRGRNTLAAMYPMMVDAVAGILGAVGPAVDNGLLSSIETRVASEIYGDVLNEAAALVNSGQVPCAAIMLRVGLENGLRRAASRAGMPDADSAKVSVVNDWLWKDAGSYPKGSHDQVEAWLAPGNAFAHDMPEKDKYTHRDLAKYIQDVQSFLATLLV